MLAFALAPVAPATGKTLSEPDAHTRPDAAERRCLAAKRRVERQREVVAEVDARIERDRKARATCSAKRACDKHDRALNASDMRKHRYQKQLTQFEAEAKTACAPP